MRFPGFKRLVHRAITHFSSMEFLSTYENQLISADHGRFWRSVVAKNCNFLPPFQSQAMRCKIRTRWAMRIIFYSSDTPRVIFLPWDHLKKGGRKGVRLFALSSNKSLQYGFFINFLCLRAIQSLVSAPLSALLFSNDPVVKIWNVGYQWNKKLSL